MKYLNERITQQIDLGSIQPKGMYKYEVQVSNLNAPEGWSTVFVGNYYNRGVRNYTFDITDICRSRKLNPHLVYTSVFNTDTNIIDIYRIIVSISGGQTVTGSEISVANVYPYPNVQKSTLSMLPSSTFFDFSSSTDYDISLLLQGNNRYRTDNNLYLTPRYPIVNNVQDLDYYTTMTFGLTIEAGRALQAATIFSVFAGNDYTNNANWLGNYNLSLNMNSHTHTFFSSYAYFLDSQQGDLPLSTDIWVYMRYINSGGTYQYRRIGVIEACKERYYLLWQDRYGSYQSQPFTGKTEFSEDIENSEYVSYTGERHKYNVQVQPKWKINSGWLAEDLFPFYESIYVSPILRLYDTKTQTEYDVIMTDSPYIEKKYHNDKKLLSIDLTLEATETQNIIY